jgi:hypothetical protein
MIHDIFFAASLQPVTMLQGHSIMGGMQQLQQVQQMQHVQQMQPVQQIQQIVTEFQPLQITEVHQVPLQPLQLVEPPPAMWLQQAAPTMVRKHPIFLVYASRWNRP